MPLNTNTFIFSSIARQVVVDGQLTEIRSFPGEMSAARDHPRVASGLEEARDRVSCDGVPDCCLKFRLVEG